jgi:hypothetical protein
MEVKRWTHAAWMAIGAAALTPANFLLSFLADLRIGGGPAGLMIAVMALIVGTAAAALSLIALYRFRELLNERYDYHGIDALVTFVIVAISLLTFVGIVGRLLMTLFGRGETDSVALALVFVVPIALLGMATGVVSIIVGVKLLSLENDLQHLIRPYAVISIIGGACLAVIILAPLGMFTLIIENIVLALLFFRANESQPMVDFV